jgi:ABC-type transport system substrate-binding protein
MRTSLRILSLALTLLVLTIAPILLRAQSIPRLTVGDLQSVDRLNPFTTASVIGATVNEYLFFSLMRTDKHNGEFVPLLAETAPHISRDGLSYTYTVHPLAKFNSGRKVSAADVVFSLKLVKNPYVNNQLIRSNYNGIASATAIDEQQLVIRLHSPSLEGLRITSGFAVVPEEIFDPERVLTDISVQDLGQVDGLSSTQNQDLKGVAQRVNAFGSSFDAIPASAYCGPYTVMSWKNGQQLLLEANKKFWGRKLAGTPNHYFEQNVEQLEFITLTSESHARNLLFEGGIDVLSGLAPAFFSDVKDIPRLQASYGFITQPGAAYEYIGLNMQGKARGRSGYLDELPVRQALSHIVYYELLLEQARFGLGSRIVADCPSMDPAFRNMDLGLPAFDPDYALQLIRDAGWHQEADGGLLTRSDSAGDTEVLVLECIYNSNHPYRAMIAEDLQARARELGLVISLVELPWENYMARLQSGDFDLYIGAWDSDPNENSYHQVWHSTNWGNGSNFVGFGDEQTDALIEAYDKIEDNNGRKDLGLEIQRLQSEQQPYVFLWQQNNSLIIKTKYNHAPISIHRPGYWLAEWN